jgi:hypothetical protein
MFYHYHASTIIVAWLFIGVAFAATTCVMATNEIEAIKQRWNISSMSVYCCILFLAITSWPLIIIVAFNNRR